MERGDVATDDDSDSLRQHSGQTFDLVSDILTDPHPSTALSTVNDGHPRPIDSPPHYSAHPVLAFTSAVQSSYIQATATAYSPSFTAPLSSGSNIDQSRSSGAPPARSHTLSPHASHVIVFQSNLDIQHQLPVAHQVHPSSFVFALYPQTEPKKTQKTRSRPLVQSVKSVKSVAEARDSRHSLQGGRRTLKYRRYTMGTLSQPDGSPAFFVLGIQGKVFTLATPEDVEKESKDLVWVNPEFVPPSSVRQERPKVYEGLPMQSDAENLGLKLRDLRKWLSPKAWSEDQSSLTLMGMFEVTLLTSCFWDEERLRSRIDSGEIIIPPNAKERALRFVMRMCCTLCQVNFEKIIRHESSNGHRQKVAEALGITIDALPDAHAFYCKYRGLGCSCTFNRHDLTVRHEEVHCCFYYGPRVPLIELKEFFAEGQLCTIDASDSIVPVVHGHADSAGKGSAPLKSSTADASGSRPQMDRYTADFIDLSTANLSGLGTSPTSNASGSSLQMGYGLQESHSPGDLSVLLESSSTVDTSSSSLQTVFELGQSAGNPLIPGSPTDASFLAELDKALDISTFTMDAADWEALGEALKEWSTTFSTGPSSSSEDSLGSSSK